MEYGELQQTMFNQVLDDGYFISYLEAGHPATLRLGAPIAYTVGRTMQDRASSTWSCGLPKADAA